ncbi:MAG: Ig-like domain-containing protein [Candidatus Sumerlaeia bacterium]|nr:Ig-like domain-containing protein [Candidatus Sumerlaeia bacterium]
MRDVSGVGTALNLTIRDPGNVTWIPGGGLLINSETFLFTTVPATKVNSACKASNEVTIEAWVKPGNLTQAGPARILGISRADGPNNTSDGGYFRNILLAQGSSSTNRDYLVRLRPGTGSASAIVNGMPNIVTPTNAATLNLTHVLFTRRSDGQYYFYVNGVSVTTGTRTGNFATDANAWDDNYRISMANEYEFDPPPGGAREWLGELHLGAIYSRFLTAAEVRQNFAAGPHAPANTPPRVTITSPADNTLYTSPATIAITADAADSGTIARVEFFANGNKIGEDSAAPYSIVWQNVSAARYVLTARATDDGGLSANSNAVNVRVMQHLTDGLQVLYTFQEGAGTTVTDVSKVGTPLHLTIRDLQNVTWLPLGGLRVTTETHLRSLVPASKVIAACKASNEVTIEAWVRPANLTQTGPARIIGISGDGSSSAQDGATSRNILLAQGSSGTARDYLVRLRPGTGSVSNGYNGMPNITTPTNTASTQILQHLLFTRRTDGQYYFYVNGVSVTTGTRTGSFATDTYRWADNFRIGMVNEYELTAGTREWRGELYGAALYSRYLSADEARRNFAAGPYSNTPPRVTITSPANNAVFETLPANITINADAADSGTVTRVEFFADGKKIGEDNSAPYSYQWQNVPAGIYELLARATDNHGAMTVSWPVTVRVGGPLGVRRWWELH